MEHVLKVKGASDGSAVCLSLDGGDAKAFRLDASISAQELFDLLAFEPGATYRVEDAGHDGITRQPYTAFVELLEDIVRKLNALKEGDA